VALKAGSSKDGKARRASVSLELSDGIVAGAGLGEIEAAQIVVEDAGGRRWRGWLGRRGVFREGEGGLFLVFVQGDGGCLLLAAAETG